VDGAAAGYGGAVELTDVRARVAALAANPAAGEVSGAAGGHGWRLEPPLTPVELESVEAQLGVRLLDEYRDFLGRVGCGGAGPAYGLLPLRLQQDGWAWDGDGTMLTAPEEMWADDTADDAGFRPLLSSSGRRYGFAEWYARWLAEAERVAENRSS
jgi:hypothetical protein